MRFSPNGNYFVVWTERGRLDLNCPEDSLRFYLSKDVANFLESSDESQRPSPVWIVRLVPRMRGQSLVTGAGWPTRRVWLS